MPAEEPRDFLGLALAHHAGVDEDAGELVADRFVQKHRHHRRIDTARKPAYHSSVPDLRANGLDGARPEGGHGPVAFAAGDAVREIPEQGRAVRGVHHLGVELDAVEAAPVVGDGGEGRRVGACHRAKTVRQSRDRIAVAHPHLLTRAHRPDPVEERTGLDDLEKRTPEFALGRGLDGTAKRRTHRLLAVADAEQRDAERVDAFIRARCLRLRERSRAARKDDALGRKARNLFRRRGKGADLAVDPGLAHAAGDQLGHLRAEIEDQDLLGHGFPSIVS